MGRYNIGNKCPIPTLMQGKGRSRQFIKRSFMSYLKNCFKNVNSASRTKLRLFLGMTLFILTAIWAWGVL